MHSTLHVKHLMIQNVIIIYDNIKAITKTLRLEVERSTKMEILDLGILSVTLRLWHPLFDICIGFRFECLF